MMNKDRAEARMKTSITWCNATGSRHCANNNSSRSSCPVNYTIAQQRE
jgi:hypothetical protein